MRAIELYFSHDHAVCRYIRHPKDTFYKLQILAYAIEMLPCQENILDAEFMVMQKDVRSDLSENIMSCFFIRSVSNSLFLELIKTTLENYWRDNDFVINYFMFEHIATIIAAYSEELASQWREMPFYNAEDAGLLQKMLCREFDETEFRKLNDITGIHKLTHKKSYDNASETSYYRHIVAGSTQSQGDEK